MSTGVPAASASSWAWHVRSMVMNHHAASSTDVCPTVSSPWFDEDHGLVPTERVRQTLALLEIEHDTGVVVEEGSGRRRRRTRPGSSGRAAGASEDQDLPYTECACAAATTSGRAAWTCEWMANAARFTGQLPSTTSPWSLTRMRSLTRIILKFMPKGLTQKWSEPLRIPSGDVTGDALVEPEMPEQSGRRRRDAACDAAARPRGCRRRETSPGGGRMARRNPTVRSAGSRAA